jgi:hypothetical protein
MSCLRGKFEKIHMVHLLSGAGFFQNLLKRKRVNLFVKIHIKTLLNPVRGETCIGERQTRTGYKSVFTITVSHAMCERFADKVFHPRFGKSKAPEAGLFSAAGEPVIVAEPHDPHDFVVELP